jgi:hypothetical protein
MYNIRIIISIVVILVISACSKDEESTTTPTVTCTSSSSGSGPTIGGVTLKEATYFQKGEATSFMFVNSTSANIAISGGSSYCYTIDVSSTTASILKTNSANTGNATMGGQSLSGFDNVTAYYMTMKMGTWTDSPSTFHMYIYAENDSSFYSNGVGYSTKAGADGVYFLNSTAFTIQ